VFLGDDGFGVEVIRHLLDRPWPDGVSVRDFGVRGIDLAYTLLEGYDAAILVDVMRRDRPPGTLYVLEPETDGPLDARCLQLEAHGMHPARVLDFVRAMGRAPSAVRLVGCEPHTFGDGDDPCMGLSEDVRLAVHPAVAIVCDLVRELLNARSERTHA
jgi:hydrogenase maturation protease